jgi:hypothetical protein
MAGVAPGPHGKPVAYVHGTVLRFEPPKLHHGDNGAANPHVLHGRAVVTFQTVSRGKTPELAEIRNLIISVKGIVPWSAKSKPKEGPFGPRWEERLTRLHLPV